MKLPSLHQIAKVAFSTSRRFPLALLDAALGTIAAFFLADWNGVHTALWTVLDNTVVAATLGIPLAIAVVFIGEKRQWTMRGMIAAQLAVAVILILYGISLPADIYAPPLVYGIRHWLLLLSAHLFVAFAPFAGKGEINGFWQYNKSLFLRFLTAGLYSGVLYAGLAVALAAVDHLFGINVRGERYLELWVVIAGLFNTWFFLSGVPENLGNLENETAYPKGLKVFTQYVLIPLVTVYVLILYAYIIKIIIEWDWPKGWVANLVLGFSITGIFSLLLVHPIRNREENVWIKRFTTWYYLAEIPLVAVLLLAIWRRVAEYGITESRYFVIALGIWLAVVVLYFLLSRSGNIKAIPASLFVFGLLTLFGPWGAFEVSERSQIHRLEDVLRRTEILKQGRIVTATSGIPFDQAREVSSIVFYLCNVHGVGVLQPWFEIDLDTLGTGGAATRGTAESDQKTRALLRLMGVDYVPEWQTRKTTYHQFTSQRGESHEVGGFEYLVTRIGLGQSDPSERSLGQLQGSIRLAGNQSVLMVKAFLPPDAGDSLQINLSTLTQKLLQQNRNPFTVPSEQMTVEGEGRRLRFKICLTKLTVLTKGDSVQTQHVEADVLIGRRTDD